MCCFCTLLKKLVQTFYFSTDLEVEELIAEPGNINQQKASPF